jgi:hypothetical protein
MVASIEVVIERRSLSELRVIMFKSRRVREAKLPVTCCFPSFLEPVVKGLKGGITSG